MMKDSAPSSAVPQWVQSINALLHEPPASYFAHTSFWLILLGFLVPLVTFLYFPIQFMNQILRWLVFYKQDNLEYVNQVKKSPDREMAIVITGCDSGFGKELALYAAHELGYVVFAGCLDHSSWKDESATTIRLETGCIIPFNMNVTKDADVQAAVQRVRDWLNEKEEASSANTRKHGQRILHALVNNAGVGRGGLIDWTTEDLADFHICMDVNYFGMVRCCKAFLPILKEQAISRIHTDARILNITSMAGLVAQGAIGMSAYSASKHAANAFSQILRAEVFPSFQIQVTTINPSFHGTPLVHSMGGLASQQWASLKASTKAEYGEDYYQRYRELCIDLPLSVTWDIAVVIRQVVRCLRMKHAPVELIVGSDARFLLMVFRMLPGWLVDRLVLLNSPPIPAAMKKH